MTAGLDGVPPFNNEAERKILGSILLDNSILDVVTSVMEPSDFFVSKHKIIYEAMALVSKSGAPIDHVTLGHELMKTGKLKEIGGAGELGDLTDNVSNASSAEYYAKIVQELSSVRRVVYAAREVSSAGFTSGDAQVVMSSLEELSLAARDLERSNMPESLLSYGEGVLEAYRKVASGYRGIPMPWKSLDDMTAGLWPKTLTMFVARPGIGKTFVAIILARHAWLCGNRVLLVSPEMSKEEIAERFFVIHSAVSYKDLISGQLGDFQLPALEKTVADLDAIAGNVLENLWIMDSENDLSPAGIDSAVRACKPGLTAVDSIYDLHIRGDRKERAVTALEWLKKSCRRNMYAAVGYSQQNRAAELSEKKGGGARLGTIALADEIGQDADNVYAMEQTKDNKDDKIIKIKPIKIRRGQYKRDSISIRWDFDKMIHDEIPEEEDDYKDEDTVF